MDVIFFGFLFCFNSYDNITFWIKPSRKELATLVYGSSFSYGLGLDAHFVELGPISITNAKEL